MRIAVVGTGSVGGTLGRRFAQAGHDVTFGARSSSSEVKGRVPPNPRVTTVADAVRDADVVMLTVPWAAVPGALRAMGALDQQILVDVTNPLVLARNWSTSRSRWRSAEWHVRSPSSSPGVRRAENDAA